jgi:flagellin-like protein
MKPILRSDREAVSPVVAEILLIAIAVVLAAVIYIMATGLLTNTGTNKPYVTFVPVDTLAADGNVSLSVAAASQSLASSAYRFTLFVDNVHPAAAASLGASGVPVSVTVGSATYLVTYQDLGGGGSLNSGDTIRITGDQAPLPEGVPITFYLIWSDGSAVQQVEWTM